AHPATLGYRYRPLRRRALESAAAALLPSLAQASRFSICRGAAGDQSRGRLAIHTAIGRWPARLDAIAQARRGRVREHGVVAGLGDAHQRNPAVDAVDGLLGGAP